MNSVDRKTILLVEDEIIIGMAAARKIARFGYEVVTTCSGIEAVKLITDDPKIALILMDIDLGNGIDGPETARRILALRQIPIVFLTSNSEKEFVDRVKKITRYGYVIKNCGDFVLQSTIEMAFELFEAQSRMRENEERYRTLFSKAGEGIFIGSTEGKVIEVNESFARMHGYSPHEMVGMPLDKLDTPETSQLAPERINRLLAGETLTFEVQHYHKDGHTFPLEVTCDLISFGGKKYLQGFHRDITGRKQAEETSAFTNALLLAEHEASLSGILAVDGNGKTLFANRLFGKMWRIPEEILLTKNDDRMLSHVLEQLSDPDGFIARVRYLYQYPEERSRDEICFKDGRVFNRFSVPVILPDGKIIARLWYFEDVTDLVQTRKRLLESEEKAGELQAEKKRLSK